MKDRLEQYILDIETLTAIGTVEEGKLQEALVDSSALEVTLRKAIDEGLIREEHLHRALESRDVIGQAKGILMEREGAHEDEALAMLETISQKDGRQATGGSHSPDRSDVDRSAPRRETGPLVGPHVLPGDRSHLERCSSLT